MTRPRGELTTYRARGGHATDWANPTRYVAMIEHGLDSPLWEVTFRRGLYPVLQNILYLKYYTLFWQRLRIMLYLYFLSVQYFKNTLLLDKIV